MSATRDKLLDILGWFVLSGAAVAEQAMRSGDSEHGVREDSDNLGYFLGDPPAHGGYPGVVEAALPTAPDTPDALLELIGAGIEDPS